MASPPPAPTARRAVLLSGHYYAARRRADFHFLADALARQGWDVTFATVRISPLSRLGGDTRFAYPVRDEANRLVPKAAGVTSFVWYTPFHVVHPRPGLMDRVSLPLAALWARLPLGALEARLRAADMVMVEGTGALPLVPRIRRMNAGARLVHRVSDDERTLGPHAAVPTVEERAAPLFDMISAPSRRMVDRFAHLGTSRLHPHGIDTDLFDRPHPNPYSGGRNAVAIGHPPHDPMLVGTLAEQFPDWSFHVIGPVPTFGRRPNIRWYGEMPFEHMPPYLLHAQVGLAPHAWRPGMEGMADSSTALKQFTWCRLPAVAPGFATRADRPHVIGYVPGDRASMRAAFARAIGVDRSGISRAGIRGWDVLARMIADPDATDGDETVVPFSRTARRGAA